MNAKFVVVVLVALQVSLALCDHHEHHGDHDPSQELVDKYNALKARLGMRLANAYHKLQEKIMSADTEQGPIEQGKIEPRKMIQEFVAAHEQKITTAQEMMSGIREEIAPIVDKIRTAMLGVYEHKLREHVRPYLDIGIKKIQGVLDTVLPVEDAPAQS